MFKEKYTLDLERKVKALETERSTVITKLLLLQVCRSYFFAAINSNVHFTSLSYYIYASNNFLLCINIRVQKECSELTAQNMAMGTMAQELEQQEKLKDGK